MNNKIAKRDFHFYFRIAVPIFAFFIPVSFHLYSGTDLSMGEFIPLFIGFTIWALVPYFALVGISFKVRSKWSLLLSAASALCAEIYGNASVHVFPKSSTSGLLFIFLPIYQMIFIMPAGLLLGYVVERVINIRKKEKKKLP